MKKMKTFDLAAITFWVLFGLYVTISSCRLGLGSFSRPGPGFIFFLSGLLLLIFSCIEIAATLSDKTTNEEDSDFKWANIRWKNILFVLGSLIAYDLILEYVGFILSTFLLLTLLFASEKPRHWRLAMVSSLITVVSAYVLFVVWLKTALPVGFIGF